MDLSALIFVALAVAWAVYLAPLALKHHDDVVRSRSVDRFSQRMRVLARREPVSRRSARLVVTPTRATSVPRVETKASSRASALLLTAAQRRAVLNRAARRRRNVLALLVLGNLGVVGLAGAGVLGWGWEGIPAALLAAWLVACRLMVRSERRRFAPPVPVLPGAANDEPRTGGAAEDAPSVADEPAAEVVAEVASGLEVTAEHPVVAGAEPQPAVPGAWDMVPTTLPTYVSKPAAARRTVATIDLDATGVWSSGRHDGDSALAREAEEAEAAQKSAHESPGRRASGS